MKKQGTEKRDTSTFAIFPMDDLDQPLKSTSVISSSTGAPFIQRNYTPPPAILSSSLPNISILPESDDQPKDTTLRTPKFTRVVGFELKQ